MHATRHATRALTKAALWVLAIGSLVGVATLPGSSGAMPKGLTLAGYGSSSLSQSALARSAPGANPASGAGPRTTPAFSIAGNVTGLYPGVTRALALTVTNHETVQITVTSITTTVSNATATCLAANVKVTAFSGSLVVAAGKTGKVTVHATMAHTAPNACQGTSFPFHYSGSASAA